MDQPQHQVFSGDGQSYRYMSYPFQKQFLQTLYPGRVMLPTYDYTGDNIPNEDPIGLDETRHQTAALAYAAKLEQEALARHLGGRDKIARHPAVEPDAIVNDPQLQWVTMETDINPNLEKVASPEDSLKKVEKIDDAIVDQVRRGMERSSPNPLSKEAVLPRYDWQASGAGYDGIQDEIIETFAMDYQKNASDTNNNRPKKRVIERFTQKSSSPVTKIVILSIFSLVLVLIILASYGLCNV